MTSSLGKCVGQEGQGVGGQIRDPIRCVYRTIGLLGGAAAVLIVMWRPYWDGVAVVAGTLIALLSLLGYQLLVRWVVGRVIRTRLLEGDQGGEEFKGFGWLKVVGFLILVTIKLFVVFAAVAGAVMWLNPIYVMLGFSMLAVGVVLCSVLGKRLED